MAIDKMITLQCVHALTNVFSHLSSSKGKIILWQNVQEAKKRILMNAKISQVNLHSKEMTFYPTSGKFYFSHHRFIYFFCLNRTTIFKATILYHSEFKLVIRLPQEIMMANSRTEERENFLTSEKLLHFRPMGYNSSLYHHARLIDLAPTGLSFQSSLSKMIRFKKGDALWMRSPFKEDKLIEGVVRYVIPVKRLTQESHLRVGVKFLNA